METLAATTTLNIDPKVFWAIVWIGGFVAACLFAYGLLSTKADPATDPLERLKKNLGLKDVNSGVFLIGGLFWGVVSILLILGLIWLIWDLIWVATPAPDDSKAIWDLRFGLVRLTALTATLGAVVALPITLQRLRLTRLQTTTADEALFNDKINAAAADLHARRLVTHQPHQADGRWDYHQDDIIKRNAAIDRLEGLVTERPDIAPRIARMLSIYVRELTSEHLPREPDENATPEALLAWARGLTACRSDMENAVQTLGRLQAIDGVRPEGVVIDLRGANLQGFDLQQASFLNARLGGAWMQGAILFRAQMQGAYLWGAQMQEADLREAQMQGANLFGAQMQGADLSEAQMQGADLSGAQMDAATDLRATAFAQVALRSVDYSTVALNQAQVDGMFYDGSVTFASGITRAPGREAVLDFREFTTQWRAWQEKIGFDRDNPGE